MGRYNFSSGCRLLLIALTAGLCAPLNAADPTSAGYREKSEQIRKQRVSERSMSLDEVVNQIRRETDGRILSAEESDSEYRIRVLTGEGKVRRLLVDPATGNIIPPRR